MDTFELQDFNKRIGLNSELKNGQRDVVYVHRV